MRARCTFHYACTYPPERRVDRVINRTRHTYNVRKHGSGPPPRVRPIGGQMIIIMNRPETCDLSIAGGTASRAHDGNGSEHLQQPPSHPLPSDSRVLPGEYGRTRYQTRGTNAPVEKFVYK